MSFRSSGRASSRSGRALAAALAVTLIVALPGGVFAQPPAPPLTLTEALARAAAADPSIAGADARQAAAEAGLRQAGVRPNPTLGIDLENFAGAGVYSMLDRTEATVSYQQTVERGGKREARIDRARAESERVRLSREVRRLDLLKAVQVAYAQALAADAELLVAEARLIAARQSQSDIERRVNSARDPLFAGSGAAAATAQAEIDRDQARQAARDTRSVVARFWGGAPDFVLDLKPFFDVAGSDAPPAPAAATADLALLEAERDIAAADVRMERARAVSDPTLRAGVRYLGDGSSLAFVVGGTIPLRRHDTNRAGVERALAERAARDADIAAGGIVRQRERARLTARIAAAATESERIRAEVIPHALLAVQQVREGFNRGGFQYLDVTEAERALAAARGRRVAVLRQLHLDRADLDRLTGRHGRPSSTSPDAEPAR